MVVDELWWIVVVGIVGVTVAVVVMDFVVSIVSVKDAVLIDVELVELMTPLVLLIMMPLVLLVMPPVLLGDIRENVSSGCCVEPVGVSKPDHVFGI